MYKFTKLLPIVLTFIAFNHSSAHSANDTETLYLVAQDKCMQKIDEPNSDLNGLQKMGVLQTRTDIENFCGCASNIVVDAYYSDLSQSQSDLMIEKGALQCMQPYIKSFATDTCINAANENGLYNMTQKCTCFGEHVQTHSAADSSGFFKNPDKYLQASAQYCKLLD